MIDTNRFREPVFHVGFQCRSRATHRVTDGYVGSTEPTAHHHRVAAAIVP
jgi:hypothetical protein